MGESDIYARNIVTGTTYLVSMNSAGTANGNGYSYDPAISADGSVVAFRSQASNLLISRPICSIMMFSRATPNQYDLSAKLQFGRHRKRERRCFLS